MLGFWPSAISCISSFSFIKQSIFFFFCGLAGSHDVAKSTTGKVKIWELFVYELDPVFPVSSLIMET